MIYNYYLCYDKLKNHWRVCEIVSKMRLRQYHISFTELSPSSVELKLRPFKDPVGVDEVSDGSYGHHLGSSDDMRMAQQQANSYHVTNTANKDWWIAIIFSRFAFKIPSTFRWFCFQARAHNF